MTAKPNGQIPKSLVTFTTVFRCYSSLLILLIWSGTGLDCAVAQTKPTEISLVVPQFKVEDLPAPGKTLKIMPRLQNSRDLTLDVRAFIVRDGSFIGLRPRTAYLDQREQPVYEFETSAPLAELVYQFVVIAKDGKTSSSPRFTVRRPCIPSFTVDESKLPQGQSFVEKTAMLAERAYRLDKELRYYESAENALKDLKTVLEEEK